MAKEEKAQKKTTAQVASEVEATLSENEFGPPAYGYGPEEFYGYPGYPYPTLSEYPEMGDGIAPYGYDMETIQGDPNAEINIFPFFRPFPFFGFGAPFFPFFRPFPFFGSPFFW